MGMGTSVRSVLRELYGPVRIPCGLVNIHTTGGAGALRRPASARSGYIYQAKHDYVTFDPLGPGRLLTGLLWHEIAGSLFLKVIHAQPSAAG